MNTLRVLVVDSDPRQAERLADRLADARHTALPSAGLEEAAEALFVQKFDAVLLGSPLPSDGVAAFVAKLRQLEKRQRGATPTPVLSLCSEIPNGAEWCAGQASAVASEAITVDGYLAASFQPAVLCEAITALAAAVARTGESRDEKSSDLPLFEPDQFRAQVSGDEELMREIIDLFLAESPTQIVEMCEALAAGDLDRLGRVAHTIKGSFASLHAGQARSHAQQLETAAKHSDAAECRAALSLLQHDLELLEPLLLALRNSSNQG